MNNAIIEFASKVFAATGRSVREREVMQFVADVEQNEVFKLGNKVQFGLCDFQTLNGRAQIIEVVL